MKKSKDTPAWEDSFIDAAAYPVFHGLHSCQGDPYKVDQKRENTILYQCLVFPLIIIHNIS